MALLNFTYFYFKIKIHQNNLHGYVPNQNLTVDWWFEILSPSNIKQVTGPFSRNGQPKKPSECPKLHACFTLLPAHKLLHQNSNSQAQSCNHVAHSNTTQQKNKKVIAKIH